MKANRCKTGIPVLDNIVEGGIPEGHIVLVAGASGTGKTIMGMSFLFEGAKNGEKGIYISMSEPKFKIIENIEDFEFYKPEVINSYTVQIFDVISEVWLGDEELHKYEKIATLILESIQKFGARRVVIDSITAICDMLKRPEEIRNFIMKLSSELVVMECTVMLISETPPQALLYSRYNIEEFISDGIILLGEFERKGDLIRTLQVIKMRGVKHSRSKYIMKITPRGIDLVPMFKTEE